LNSLEIISKKPYMSALKPRGISDQRNSMHNCRSTSRHFTLYSVHCQPEAIDSKFTSERWCTDKRPPEKGHLFTKTYLTKSYNRFVVQFFC